MSSPINVEPVQVCASCGASVYKEHLDRGLAGLRSGQLLCHHCLQEKAAAQAQPPKPAPPQPAVVIPPAPAPSAAPPAAKPSGVPIEDVPIQLVEEREASDSRAAVATPPAPEPIRDFIAFKRPLNPASRGATRMRTFHAKLSDAAIHHLDQLVNTWLDGHPDIEVKFATTTVGMFEGKHPEPNLIITIFY